MRLPRPFPVPMFRAQTTTNFSHKKLTDTDRKCVIQTLATMLMTYIPKPSLDNCGDVAKALIRRYPFLNDGVGDGEVTIHSCTRCTTIILYILQHSWKYYIYYRCSNVNRTAKSVIDSTSASSPKPKRKKTIDHSAHLYLPLDELDDEVAYGRNLDLLKSELSKPKPKTDSLKDLMKCTFPNCWDAIVNAFEPIWVQDHVADFPLLKKAMHVSGTTFMFLASKPCTVCSGIFYVCWNSSCYFYSYFNPFAFRAVVTYSIGANF